MLDPIVNFFVRVFNAIGRGIGWVIAAVLFPFVWVTRWVRKRGFALKSVFALVLIGIVAGYFYLIWQTQRYPGFDIAYTARYNWTERNISAGEQVVAEGEAAGSGDTRTCAPSAIVQVTRDLIDFNVNQNQWVPSMLFQKLGLFGLDWKYTPFFDNKAAFQRGINQAVRRTSAELIDRLGRVRGTSQLDGDLQSAREAVFYPEDLWYVSGLRPVQPTPSRFRAAIPALEKFNDRLVKCEATFDPRADNLVQFLDRVTSDIGSTSDILREQTERSNAGWFDFRADDRFWFTFGQLYGYSGIMRAARADFNSVVETRGLASVWARLEQQFEQALAIQPLVISNGAEDGFIMPTHLATEGFYVLRVRSNLVEMRDILDR
ncbi:MAG: DUF2333 family protein [Pseudomonadota bacterium]